MSNYPGYPAPFSTWDTFTPSIRPQFPLGSLHIAGLAPGISGLSDPAYLPSFRTPLCDPLSSLAATSHLARPPAFPRYLPVTSDLPVLGLEPVYGFGPLEPRGVLLSPNLSFSQNPSPLTFDQIYRSGASSVSPVSQYRSHFDERALGTRLSVPGRFSEPLRRDSFLTSKWIDKDKYTAKETNKAATEIHKSSDKNVKIWKPFDVDSKKKDTSKDTVESKVGSTFSIEALTRDTNKGNVGDSALTVDANGNNVTKCIPDKTWPERPVAKYPIRPIPVFSAGCSLPSDGFGANPISDCYNLCSGSLQFPRCSSVQIDSLKFGKDFVNKDTKVHDKQILDDDTQKSENELKWDDKKEVLDSNEKTCVITISDESAGETVKESDIKIDAVTSNYNSKSDQKYFFQIKDSSADKSVPYVEKDTDKVTKQLQISLPKLEIEIPTTQCSDTSKETGKSSKQSEICSPSVSSKVKTVSPSKRGTKREELKLLSIQVNEVRNRRTSKDSKLLSPTLSSPNGRRDSAASDKVLSPPIIETVPKSKSKCLKVVEKRRLSLPIIGRSSGQVRYLARMSSAEGAITMMKNTEDSLSASISSSHLSESDSDTQLSNDNAEKLFQESQAMNTQQSFSSAAPTGNPGYMSNLGVENMNHDNQYYKPNTPQMCQSESDNQKPYQCVQGPMFHEKPDVLPPYSCFTTNQSPNVLPRDPSFHSQEENSNFPPSLAGVNSSMEYDENSVMSDSSQMRPPRCDSQSSISHGADGPMPCKDPQLQGNINTPNQEPYTPVPDEGQWDFLHSKQYIDNIYQGGCEIVKSEADELRESDSPKTFIDLDKTTKEKKAQETQKDKSKDGYGSKHYGKAFGRPGYPGVHRNNVAMYGNQYDNYSHMAGNRWSNFNRNEGMMGNQPRPSGDNYSSAYDHSHQYRNNYPPNYPNMTQSQNGGDKPAYNNQPGYHGNEYNQNDYYNQNQPVKSFQGNYGNNRFDNGYYQNRGANEYNSQNNIYPSNPGEMQGPRFPSQGFTGGQGNYNQHYGQQTSSHCGPENQGQYQESTGFNIPRNASPASTGSDFGNMEAPGGIPKKKRGRKRKIDKEPPDENKPRPNTIVMAPTKIGPLVDIDNPESTIDTYDYNNQIETIFNFTIEDDLSPIGAQYLQIEQRLCQKMLPIKYGYPVTVIYSPLTYAFQTHRDFVAKYCTSERTLLFLGMNPGPYGMSQNGVPFGEAIVTRDWLKITGDVYKPEIEHPKKPVTGLACTRNEVSGARFWGLFQKVCKVPENFFKNSFVYNFCPLAYMSESGKNVTPPQLVHSELDQINECCDVSLIELVKLLNIRAIIAVGKFVQQRASKALHNAGIMNIKVECILHPSPINPHANKGWEQIVAKQLIEMNVMHYLNPDMEDVQRCIEEWERIAQSNVKVPVMEKGEY